MPNYSLEQFLEVVKRERTLNLSPYELVYKSFVKLGYDQQGVGFFKNNASQIVEELRDACWTNYLPEEEKFTSEMMKKLIDEDVLNQESSEQSLNLFLDKYPKYIYQLCLSNTQSRRSRAGKEFEAIIELLLMGAQIPMDSQGNIGKSTFVNKGLGKLVDVVSPGVVEYIIDKSYTCLISAKTTLRERWQEVPEELSRTGAREMFLATLDEGISKEVFDTCYESNIRIVTTKSNKQKNYQNERRIIDFEELLSLCEHTDNHWGIDRYNDEEKETIKNSINLQIQKHQNHPFVLKYFNDRLNKIEGHNVFTYENVEIPTLKVAQRLEE